MYISIVTLHVDDIDRAVKFYTEKLGWKVTMDVPMGEDRWVTIAPADASSTHGAGAAFNPTTASFTISKRDPDDPGDKPGMSGVILETDDVFATHKKLSSAGVEFTADPQMMPWGGWTMFKDTEGNVHGLHSPATAGVSSN